MTEAARPFNRWSPRPKEPPAARRTTFVGGDPGKRTHPVGAIVPLDNEAGFAWASYSVWTSTLQNGLNEPWVWAVPQSGNPTKQACATRDGIRIGINNELEREGITARVRRL